MYGMRMGDQEMRSEINYNSNKRLEDSSFYHFPLRHFGKQRTGLEDVLVNICPRQEECIPERRLYNYRGDLVRVRFPMPRAPRHFSSQASPARGEGLVFPRKFCGVWGRKLRIPFCTVNCDDGVVRRYEGFTVY